MLDFLFPPFCLVCRVRTGPGEGVVCEKCWKNSLRENRGPFFIGPAGIADEADERSFYARSAGHWNDDLGQILHKFKYGGFPSLGERLARSLSVTALGDPSLLASDRIVPMPLTRARKAERGFNQSEILARTLSRSIGIPVATDLVRRRGRSRSQTRLSPAERRRNVRGVFRLRSERGVRGARVLIVDDVITTGATSHELAALLRRGGARSVAVLAVARVSGEPFSSLSPSSSSEPGRPGGSKKRRSGPTTGWWKRRGGSTRSTR